MLYPLRNQMEVRKKKLQMYPMDWSHQTIGKPNLRFCASKGVRPNELSAICPSVQMSLRKTCIYTSALVDVYIPRERRRKHLTHPSSSIQSCPFPGRLVDPSLQLGVWTADESCAPWAPVPAAIMVACSPSPQVMLEYFTKPLAPNHDGHDGRKTKWKIEALVCSSSAEPSWGYGRSTSEIPANWMVIKSTAKHCQEMVAARFWHISYWQDTVYVAFRNIHLIKTTTFTLRKMNQLSDYETGQDWDHSFPIVAEYSPELNENSRRRLRDNWLPESSMAFHHSCCRLLLRF